MSSKWKSSRGLARSVFFNYRGLLYVRDFEIRPSNGSRYLKLSRVVLVERILRRKHPGAMEVQIAPIVQVEMKPWRLVFAEAPQNTGLSYIGPGTDFNRYKSDVNFVIPQR